MYLYANENALVESVHLMLQSKGQIAGAMGLGRKEEKVRDLWGLTQCATIMGRIDWLYFRVRKF